MINWLFEKPGRLWGTVAIAAGVALVVAVAVLLIRVDRVTDQMESAGSTTPGISVPTGEEQAGVTPDPEPSRRPLSSVPAEEAPAGGEPQDAPVGTDAFVDAGDPEPRVAAAINAWAAWKFEDLATYMLPAAEEDAIANPPGPKANDLKITGIVAVVEPGPSQAVVEVPTNKGILLADVVIKEREWYIASMGWK